MNKIVPASQNGSSNNVTVFPMRVMVDGQEYMVTNIRAAKKHLTHGKLSKTMTFSLQLKPVGPTKDKKIIYRMVKLSGIPGDVEVLDPKI